MSDKKELIQRTVEMLKGISPQTDIAAVNNPETGDIVWLPITAEELRAILAAIIQPFFVIEGNPSVADDIAKLMHAGVPMSILPAPATIEWVPDTALAKTILSIVGNVEYKGGGANSARMYADMLNDIRSVTLAATSTKGGTCPRCGVATTEQPTHGFMAKCGERVLVARVEGCPADLLDEDGNPVTPIRKDGE